MSSKLHFNCALTTDCIVFSNDGSAVLIRRKNPPFEGEYALPGGFVDEDETTDQACFREAKEETGLDLKNLKLVGVYSDPDRDPRGRTVSAAYLAEADLSKLEAGDDAAEVELVVNWREKKLAFDHAEILNDAWKIHSNK